MLSILIPVYNYDIVELVTEVHRQLQKLNIPYEIYCLDDKSELSFIEKNKQIECLSHTSYQISEVNNGRERSRQLLCEKSTFDHLLFLDADTFPRRANFMEIYTSYLKSGQEAVFGGILYESQPPGIDYLLRWKYGKQNESLNANERNRAPYISITSPNFLIKKSVFNSINSIIKGNDYGLDIYFASLMKRKQINILHIDNEVFHLGIEKNADYLMKSEEALKTYLKLLNKGKINSDDNRLLRLFVALRKYKINYIFYSFYKVFGNSIKKNLCGDNPSIKMFQLYRLSYLCTIDLRLK